MCIRDRFLTSISIFNNTWKKLDYTRNAALTVSCLMSVTPMNKNGIFKQERALSGLYVYVCAVGLFMNQFISSY